MPITSLVRRTIFGGAKNILRDLRGAKDDLGNATRHAMAVPAETVTAAREQGLLYKLIRRRRKATVNEQTATTTKQTKANAHYKT